MKFIVVLILMLLSGCLGSGTVDINDRDFAVELSEIEAMTGLPGAGTVQANGCRLVVKNAQILAETGVDIADLVSAVRLETPQCNAGGTPVAED